MLRALWTFAVGSDAMKERVRRRERALTGSSYSGGLAFSLASFGAIGIITLLTSVLSARLYGIKVIGQAALVLAPITLVTLLSTVREQPAMVRELAKLEPRHPRVTGVFLAVFLFSFTLTAVVSGLGVVACYFAFNGPLHKPALIDPAAVALCGYLVLINTCWNIDGVFGAFRAGRELFVVRLHQAALYGVLLAAATLLTHSVWGIVWALLGSYLSALVHRLALLPRVITLRAPLAEVRAGFATLRTIVTFGLKMTPGFLAAGFSEASGTWILGATSSVSVVGAYSRAWTFAARLTEINWRISEMLLPTLVQHRHAGNSEAFDRVLSESLRYAGFGMLLPAAVGGGAAEAIMHIFGEGFAAGATALPLLLLVPLFQTLTAIQGTALTAYNRPLLTSFAQTMRLVVTLVGGIGLTLAYGITGMAIAIAAGSVVCFGVYGVILRFRMAGSMPRPLQLRQLAGLGAAYGSGFAVSHVVERQVHGGFGLIMALVAGSLAYIAVGIGVSGTTNRDRARLQLTLERITRRRVSPVKMTSAA
jgi:O-antigen/teichoic acid export membrane protein